MMLVGEARRFADGVEEVVADFDDTTSIVAALVGVVASGRGGRSSSDRCGRRWL
jgi:uncharacterized protein YbjT (DUF2867 family)